MRRFFGALHAQESCDKSLGGNRGFYVCAWIITDLFSKHLYNPHP